MAEEKISDMHLMGKWPLALLIILIIAALFITKMLSIQPISEQNGYPPPIKGWPNERILLEFTPEAKAEEMRYGFFPDFGDGTDMHKIAARASVHEVKQALNTGADLIVRNWLGETPLHSAVSVERGKHLSTDDDERIAEVVTLLIKAGASLNTRTFKGETPLKYAVENGYTAAVRVLIIAGADPNLADFMGEIPYEIAVNPATRALLPQVELPTMSKKDELFLEAFRKDDLGEIERALSSGNANPNLISHNWGDTPLIAAARHGNLPLVKILIKYGANLNYQNPFGTTPLNKAVQLAKINNPEENGEVALFLIAQGANTELADNIGRAPLWWAAAKGQTNVVDALLKAGANVNVCDTFGWTPLGWVSHYDPQMEELLRSHGAQE